LAATIIDSVEVKLGTARDLNDDGIEPTVFLVTFVGHITDGATRYAFSETKSISMSSDWAAGDTADLLEDALASTPFGV